MPVKSKAQASLMKAVLAGKAKGVSLTKEEAKEFLKGIKIKDLPRKVKKNSANNKKRRN